MSKSEKYLAMSMQFWAEAEATTDPVLRADLEWLAKSYRLLAERADAETSVIDLVPRQSAEQQQPQQQQQGKLEPEE